MYSHDGRRWFSDKADVQLYLMRKTKTEARLKPRRNPPMTRFTE